MPEALRTYHWLMLSGKEGKLEEALGKLETREEAITVVRYDCVKDEVEMWERGDNGWTDDWPSNFS